MQDCESQVSINRYSNSIPPKMDSDDTKQSSCEKDVVYDWQDCLHTEGDSLVISLNCRLKLDDSL